MIVFCKSGKNRSYIKILSHRPSSTNNLEKRTLRQKDSDLTVNGKPTHSNHDKDVQGIRY